MNSYLLLQEKSVKAKASLTNNMNRENTVLHSKHLVSAYL